MEISISPLLLYASLSDDIKHCDIVIDDVDRNGLVFVKLKGDKLIVVAAFEKNVDFDGDKVHKATTVHHRQYIAPMISKLSENSTIYTKSKKELDTLSRRVGIIPTAYNSKIKFFDEIVSEYVPNVKYSTKNSNGEQLTPGQIEYFKDSKVRDENGTIARHGGGRSTFYSRN